MSAITLKSIPDEMHRKIKRMQLDLQDEGLNKSLEEIYIDLIRKGIEISETKKPSK